MLKEGDKAPAWSSTDADGTTRFSTDFSGQWLLLYFYPKDDTPGCTIEACKFRDGYATLKDLVTIVGVSADSEESHRSFIGKYSLPFMLLSDADRSLITAFGTDGSAYPKRTSFLIDPEGVIRKIYHGFDCNDHADDVRKDLTELGA